jgi:hypothetical protein
MPKPPLQFTRPSRPEARNDVRPAPSPAIDLDSPEVQAFSLRGRVTVPPSVENMTDEEPRAIAPTARSRTPAAEGEPLPIAEPAVDDPWRYVAVKLPTVSGRKLSEIADLRCSKRTRIAIEVLQYPLRDLAGAHRAGKYPPLRRVSVGVSRSGVSLILPQDLADDLRYVVEIRRAVKAQILTRLLVPEIDALFLKEVLGRQ